MNKLIERSDINKYRTRKQMIHMGWCHLKDGLILLLSLGEYRGAYSTEACVDLLQNASNMCKVERKEAERVACATGNCNHPSNDPH